MAQGMTLEEFVAAECEIPVRPGEQPCAAFVARWVLCQTGKDGRAIFGGLSDETARELLAVGPMIRALRTAAASIGLQITHDPKPGDVAALRAGPRHVCGIWSGARWIIRDADGVGTLSPEIVRPLRCWSV